LLASDHPERHPHDGSRPRVLIIEDILDQLDLYAMVLHPHVEVLKASRGEAGFLAACIQVPDMIVLDLLLPDVSGFEICRRLRATSVTAKIPVIILSGDEPSVFKAMSTYDCVHAFAILKKPALVDQLLATIRAAVAQPRI
jgi:DNA-binding response OmpR family regulator